MSIHFYHNLDSIPVFEEAYVTVGNFDGLHRGHQRIITAMQSDAGKKPTIAMTFEEATSLYINPHEFKGYLFPEDYKQKALSLMGIQNIISLRFEEIADLDSIDFIRVLKNKIKKVHFYVGYDFKFGKGNSGNIHTLQRHASDKTFILNVMEKMKYHFSTISSSSIREKIKHGDLEAAQAMLGRPYFIVSNKIAGDGAGKKIGFPTINIEINQQVLPQIGVYFSLFYFKKKLYPSMSYIGNRPTMTHHEMRNETNILDFDGDYGEIKTGEKQTVLFIKKIRNEKKFNNLEELEKNLYNDRRQVLELYQEYKKKPDFPDTGLFM